MRFPLTIRLDQSDAQVFDKAAEPGEPAVPGAFTFAGRDPEGLSTKDKLALRSAWLGTHSFGFSTLVEVGEIDEAAFFATVERLARYFVESLGAPDLAAALPVAREECDEAAALCTHPIHSLLAVERDFNEAGQLVERFRVVQPSRATDHAKIWSIETDAEDGAPGR
jgi:hypothetical protein